jgi:hypothetical protein
MEGEVAVAPRQGRAHGHAHRSASLRALCRHCPPNESERTARRPGPQHKARRSHPSCIGLLHRNASAEEFAAASPHVEALPDAVQRKSSLVELVRMAMALRNRLELHEQRERGMLAVIESAQDLSSRLDLSGPAEGHRERARKLMGSHLCWLTIYDAASGEFQVVVADGAISDRTGKMTAGRNLGVAGIVMSTRLPFFTPDYLHDNRFAHDPALDDTFRDEGVAALVGAPLMCDDNVIGLLFVADRYHRTHTAHERVDPVHPRHPRGRRHQQRQGLRGSRRPRSTTRTWRATSWSGMCATCRRPPRRTSS